MSWGRAQPQPPVPPQGSAARPRGKDVVAPCLGIGRRTKFRGPWPERGSGIALSLAPHEVRPGWGVPSGSGMSTLWLAAFLRVAAGLLARFENNPPRYGEAQAELVGCRRLATSETTGQRSAEGSRDTGPRTCRDASFDLGSIDGPTGERSAP